MSENDRWGVPTKKSGRKKAAEEKLPLLLFYTSF